MAPGRPLPFPEYPDDVESIQLRHVNVQEQQVESLSARQVQRLPAVGRQPHAVSAQAQDLLQVLRVELIVLGDEDV